MSKKNKSTVQVAENQNLDEGMVFEEKSKVSSSNQISLKEYSKKAPFAFDARNYRILLIGLAVNVLGFILMMGGGTDDPAKFDGGALFSVTRITISPLLIVTGYGIIMYGIMKKNNKGTSDNE